MNIITFTDCQNNHNFHDFILGKIENHKFCLLSSLLLEVQILNMFINICLLQTFKCACLRLRPADQNSLSEYWYK